jgi:hypothetical protein
VKPQTRIVVGKPHTFGWLRCIECDSIISGSYFEGWERPDGGIVRIPRQEHDKPIKTIVAVRKRNSVLVISPRGTTETFSPLPVATVRNGAHPSNRYKQ